MNSATDETSMARAQHITITADALAVDLVDGRTVSVPLAWYPRLLHGTPQERNNWRLIGDGEGIHWRDLDEDISIESLLTGKPSGESQSSFARWLKQRGEHEPASYAPDTAPLYAICVDNSGYSAALAVNKIYRVLPDDNAAQAGDLRVMDEHGTDYCYPANRFVVLQLPHDTAQVLEASFARAVT